MKAVKTKCKFEKENRHNPLRLIQFQFFIFYNLTCLQKHFHRRVLSADGHYGLIVSLCGQTLCHMINLNQ